MIPLDDDGHSHGDDDDDGGGRDGDIYIRQEWFFIPLRLNLFLDLFLDS